MILRPKPGKRLGLDTVNHGYKKGALTNVKTTTPVCTPFVNYFITRKRASIKGALIGEEDMSDIAINHITEELKEMNKTLKRIERELTNSNQIARILCTRLGQKETETEDDKK